MSHNRPRRGPTGGAIGDESQVVPPAWPPVLALPPKPWPSQAFIHRPAMPQRGNFFHLHLVSDATGETLITVARAAAAQYATVAPIEHIYPLVRTEKQLDRVIAEIETAPGIVLYTLLDPDLTERLESKCRDLGLPVMSILGPVLNLFQSYLGAEIGLEQDRK